MNELNLVAFLSLVMAVNVFIIIIGFRMALKNMKEDNDKK